MLLTFNGLNASGKTTILKEVRKILKSNNKTTSTWYCKKLISHRDITACLNPNVVFNRDMFLDDIATHDYVLFENYGILFERPFLQKRLKGQPITQQVVDDVLRSFETAGLPFMESGLHFWIYLRTQELQNRRHSHDPNRKDRANLWMRKGKDTEFERRMTFYKHFVDRGLMIPIDNSKNIEQTTEEVLHYVSS